MGLDVHVFKNITKSNDEDACGFVAFVVSERWNHKIRNLDLNARYTGDVADESISCAYGYHSRFRESLIKLIGRDDLLKEDGTINWAILPCGIPFYDFIDFADNEGCLDWETSKHIYNDFKNFESKAKDFYNDFQFDFYQKWLNIFKTAQNKGVVVFS